MLDAVVELGATGVVGAVLDERACELLDPGAPSGVDVDLVDLSAADEEVPAEGVHDTAGPEAGGGVPSGGGQDVVGVVGVGGVGVVGLDGGGAGGAGPEAGGGAGACPAGGCTAGACTAGAGATAGAAAAATGAAAPDVAATAGGMVTLGAGARSR